MKTPELFKVPYKAFLFSCMLSILLAGIFAEFKLTGMVISFALMAVVLACASVVAYETRREHYPYKKHGDNY